MKYVLAAIALFGSLVLGMPAAHAFSAQTGDSVPGTFANLTDPDAQSPFILKASPNGKTASSDNFDDAPDGQGFVSKDAMQHSMDRGSGTYLPPDTEK